MSTSDFPVLVANSTEAPPLIQDDSVTSAEIKKTQAQERAERKAAKASAAAAERAAERQRLVQERAAAKAAEKAELARKKAEDKERLLQEQAAEAERRRIEAERRKAEELALKMERENAARLEREASEKEREKEKEKEKEKAARVEKERIAALRKAQKQAEALKTATKARDQPSQVASQAQVKPSAQNVPQVPLLSKKPKKTKAAVKPVRGPKDDEHLHDEASTLLSAATPETPRLPSQTTNSSHVNSRSHSVERQSNRATVQELLEQIHVSKPHWDLVNHPFFDIFKVASSSRMPLEYGPLVHALSALSVGGTSFSGDAPSNSIDNAVSSFQQLLETLTQTISDLLRLLPRTTWDDSSSFDSVLRDMLKSDDFLDETAEESGVKEDEVIALTLALERRARWMEVQLSKLEELHRDINNAAVRAILAFNDNGWDKNAFLPRLANTLHRFEQIGMVTENGSMRQMSIEELEKKLVVSKEAAVFAETEVREMMEKFQGIKLDSLVF